MNWKFIPMRVEGVIEKRISHLDAMLQNVLSVASVEGQQFSPQVIARVLGLSEGVLIRKLSQELANRCCLVVEQEPVRGNSSQLAHYKFAHPLYQQYLYDQLGQQERVTLHRRIAHVLEELYVGHTEDIAFQLVLHYADDPEKELIYARIAGERAATQFAHQEALRYFDLALELTPSRNHKGRFDILLAREKVYDILGERQAQQQDLSDLEKLAYLMNDQGKESIIRLAKVELRKAQYARCCSDYPAAIAAAQSALKLGEEIQDLAIQASASLEWGRALLFTSHFSETQILLEKGLDLARLVQNRRLEGWILHYLGFSRYRSGENISSDQIDVYFDQSKSIFNELGDSYEESQILNNLALICLDRDDYIGAKKYLEELLQISRRYGYRLGEAYALTNLPLCFMFYGDYPTAIRTLEQALLIDKEIDNRYMYWCGLLFLCICYRYTGNLQSSEHYGKQALEIAQEIGTRYCRVNSLNHYGHTQFALGRWDDAYSSYHDSIKITSEVGTPAFESEAQEANAGLIQILYAQGKLTQAMEQIEVWSSDLECCNIVVFEGHWIYTLGYKVLKASGDSRADSILQRAHDLFLKESAQFDDEEMRRSYLENVPAHREIIHEWQARQES